MQTILTRDFLAPVLLTLRVSITASVIVFFLGFAAAWWMVQKKFPGKVFLETLFMLPMVLAPTVVGFLLLVVLGKRGWIGIWIERLFKQTILFTWWAAVIAAVVVSFPIVYQTMKTGLAAIDDELVAAARSIGANEWQLFRYVIVPLSFRTMLTAYIVGFVRSLGEFGATLMIAGNIPGKTQTVSTAIYLAIDTENMTLAWYLVGTMIVFSFLFLLIVNRKSNATIG
ncbi:molybdate ABC transporter permease subunit [Fodinisporobacter ferrooxydans]|uniref:Molybdenum transport system permease n=1 Tax=Fodinisporobacter ferrooxydans TaxID=2901836 RepID=A0ABY4CMY6_9BACL|nr:molybdate ABC transporter permease subunit [Alicyclobacillaceae bacterium MYW30-H2]